VGGYFQRKVTVWCVSVSLFCQLTFSYLCRCIHFQLFRLCAKLHHQPHEIIIIFYFVKLHLDYSHIWSDVSHLRLYLTSVPQPYHWRALDGLTWKSCLNKSVTLPHPATMKTVKRSCSRYFLCIYRHSPTYAIVTLPTGGSGASPVLSKLDVSNTYGKLYSKGFPWNPHSTLDPDRPQHDRPVVCVIAQQYSSATLFLSALSFP